MLSFSQMLVKIKYSRPHSCRPSSQKRCGLGAVRFRTIFSLHSLQPFLRTQAPAPLVRRKQTDVSMESAWGLPSYRNTPFPSAPTTCPQCLRQSHGQQDLQGRCHHRKPNSRVLLRIRTFLSPNFPSRIGFESLKTASSGRLREKTAAPVPSPHRGLQVSLSPLGLSSRIFK